MKIAVFIFFQVLHDSKSDLASVGLERRSSFFVVEREGVLRKEQTNRSGPLSPQRRSHRAKEKGNPELLVANSFLEALKGHEIKGLY